MIRFKVLLVLLSVAMPLARGQGEASLARLVQADQSRSGARLYTNQSLAQMQAMVTVSSAQLEGLEGATGSQPSGEKEELEAALRQAAIDLALSKNRVRILQVKTAAISDLHFSEYDGATQLYYLSLLEGGALGIQARRSEVRMARGRLRSLIKEARGAGFYPGQIRRLTRSAGSTVRLKADPTDEIF